MRFFYIYLVFLNSCGSDSVETRQIPNFEICSVEEVSEGAVITCPDGSEVLVEDGADGQDGQKGLDGTNGKDGQDGIDGLNGQDGIDGKDGKRGAKGAPGQDGEDLRFSDQDDFYGYWLFPQGGFLELLIETDGRIRIWGAQSLRSTNFDGGGAIHPNLPAGPHSIKSGIITGTYNTNYSSSSNDVEIDGTTSNITGTRSTNYRLYKNEYGKLVIELLVFSSSGLSVEANRILTSE